MKILIEGERYHITDLEHIFDDQKFYAQSAGVGIITGVGYYHSYISNELVYILPKVFIQNGLVFGSHTPEALFDLEVIASFKHDQSYLWIRQLLVFFYNSLTEFRKRFPLNQIAESSQAFELNSNLGENEYSYLDLLLSFTNYYKKNKSIILFQHKEQISSAHKKVKWEKTVRSSQPVIFGGEDPIYLKNRNKQTIRDTGEQLICYYFSILNHFNTEHNLGLKIDKSFPILKGEKFKTLQKTGLSKLRSIKYRYFSDIFKRMYQLCELYFSKTDQTSIKRKKQEFISIRNYNIVFEDMIDKLFSDKIDDTIKSDKISLNDLKYNKDGKIIDHIFEYQSLIDNSNIFYIGDSKYYKSDSAAGNISTFKQFTYAKNVIQFNVDLLNEGYRYSEFTRYRDTITDGYNISPNFFIYGYIDAVDDFHAPQLIPYKMPKKAFHFKDRLFDRDTLFVHQYRINFLFVLKNYCNSNSGQIETFRKETKQAFREKFIEYFNDEASCDFIIYQKKYDNAKKLTDFVTLNFKILNGKCIAINQHELLVAKFSEDESLAPLIHDFEIKTLS